MRVGVRVFVGAAQPFCLVVFMAVSVCVCMSGYISAGISASVFVCVCAFINNFVLAAILLFVL